MTCCPTAHQHAVPFIILSTFCNVRTCGSCCAGHLPSTCSQQQARACLDPQPGVQGGQGLQSGQELCWVGCTVQQTSCAPFQVWQASQRLPHRPQGPAICIACSRSPSARLPEQGFRAPTMLQVETQHGFHAPAGQALHSAGEPHSQCHAAECCCKVQLAGGHGLAVGARPAMPAACSSCTASRRARMLGAWLSG